MCAIGRFISLPALAEAMGCGGATNPLQAVTVLATQKARQCLHILLSFPSTGKVFVHYAGQKGDGDFAVVLLPAVTSSQNIRNSSELEDLNTPLRLKTCFCICLLVPIA